jgi:hypothetical protein
MDDTMKTSTTRIIETHPIATCSGPKFYAWINGRVDLSIKPSSRPEIVLRRATRGAM